MIKKTYINEEIDKIILDESGITGFSWIGEEELDFEINVDWNGQYDLVNHFDFMNIKTILRFEWVTEVKIMIDFKDQIKAPAIQSFSYKENNNGTFNINIDCNFDSIGYINLNCSKFFFQIID